MRIQRLGVAAVLAALSVSAAACGTSGSSNTDTSPPNPAPAATSTAPAGASDGVTSTTDTFGAACGQLPQGDAPGSLTTMGPQPVATAASANPMLSTLVTAVKAASLVEVLNSQRSLTVFAPSNSAFAEAEKAMGEQKFKALLANKEALGNVLQYHVLPGRYDRQGLVGLGTSSPLAGGKLQFKDTGDTMTVTDGSGATANVLCGNVPTANATVFIIDKVLMKGAS